MLSRLAESLYWVGRYTERAEDTARILDVHFHLVLEGATLDEGAVWSNLMQVMGARRPHDVVANAASTTNFLAYDATSPSSILGAMAAARDNAAGAREAISAQMWESLNASFFAVEELLEVSDGSGPHRFFEFVKERSAILQGLADSTMSHDDGWRFLVLGRNLERVDMTARLLTARLAEGVEATGWVTTLRCCSAHEAYLRAYRRAVDASLVVEFLLLDRLFPRSVYSALCAAEAALAGLSPTVGRSGVEDEARRILGRVRNDLEYRRANELLRDLPAHLTDIQNACSAAHVAVTDRYFRHTRVIEWSA
ncbi:MAG: alpha-E domain-containing protein [Acidimicrobiales bacterium]